ncbi:type II secretion system protein [Evansella halocellulosilytica]|uniref:type II secretion system protein n=1 Tax=Evansella halocellulosilytica TaxID=2011013 RepID=UPI0015CC12A7|nr:type II secretion system protein [Evansella halocellulosilytica]
MRNDNAFTLIEVVVGLFIISIVISVTFPFITFIQNERISIKQERIAEAILDEVYYETVVNRQVDTEQVIRVNHFAYYLTFHNENEPLSICLQWEGRNNRPYERCLYV